MPRLAIVISGVGSIESLEGTLVSVLENRPADCEVIVALNQPYADPYDLKGEVRFIQAAERGPSMSCLNQALSTTRAPFVHLLSSGCEVTEGWADQALARFGDRQLGAVAPLVFDAANRDRIFAAGLGYRPRGKRLLLAQGKKELPPTATSAMVGPCGFAGFYRKAALDLVGGLSPQLGYQQADADLAMALKHAGFTVTLEPHSRVFAAASVDRPASAWRKSLHDERLFWRNMPKSNRLALLASHASLVAIELICSFPRPRMLAQIAGRMIGMAAIGSGARHRQAVEALSRHSMQSKLASERMRLDRSHEGSASSETLKSRVH